MALFSVYVSNLAPDVTENDVWEAFQQCGNVRDVYLRKLSDQPCISGFVRYDNLKSVSKAVSELNGWPMKGRNIHVEVAHDTKRLLTAFCTGKDEDALKKYHQVRAGISEACAEINNKVKCLGGDAAVDAKWVLEQMAVQRPGKMKIVKCMPDTEGLTSLESLCEKLFSGDYASLVPENANVNVSTFWAACKKICDDVHKFHKKHDESTAFGLANFKPDHPATDFSLANSVITCNERESGSVDSEKEHLGKSPNELDSTGIIVTGTPETCTHGQQTKSSRRDCLESYLPIPCGNMQVQKKYTMEDLYFDSEVAPASVCKNTSLLKSSTFASSSEQDMDASPGRCRSLADDVKDTEADLHLITSRLQEEPSISTPASGRIQDVEMSEKLQQLLDQGVQGEDLTLHKNSDYLTLLQEYGRACSRLLSASSWDKPEVSRDSGIDEELFDSDELARRSSLSKTMETEHCTLSARKANKEVCGKTENQPQSETETQSSKLSSFLSQTSVSVGRGRALLDLCTNGVGLAEQNKKQKNCTT